MNIYTPYTYLIGWTEMNQFYYGVRWANRCAPEDDLWVHYFTSSTSVKEFRKTYGEPDIVKVDRTFDNKNDAIAYEFAYLMENNTIKSDNWLNKSAFPVRDNTGKERPEHSKKMSGENNPMKRKDVREKMSELQKNRVFSATHRQNISKGRTGTKNSVPRSSEYLRKQSESQRGQVRKKVQCPHCKKIGGAGGGMHRFHFDNCSARVVAP